MSQGNLEKVIHRVGELPAMPEVATEVIRLTDDPGVDIGEVGEVIQQDPALTAKLLQVSNSAYYGMRQVVGTVKLALVILGVSEVRNIVLALSVFDAFGGKGKVEELTRDGFWNHSFRVGAIAKRLGSHFELSFQGEDFVAGLLHDIGKLVLWNQLEEEYQDIYHASKQDGADLYALELDALGFDHADAGAALLRYWDMPETLADAVAYHHARDDRALTEAIDPKLAALVRVANLAALDDWSDDPSVTLRSCEDEEAWALLEEFKEALDEDGRRELLNGFCEEVGEMTPIAF